MITTIGIGLACFLAGLILPSFFIKKTTVSTPKIIDVEVKKESDK